MKNTDQRFISIKKRLSLLSDEELNRIISNTDIMLFDTYNYNDGKYCPLAIALDLHNKVKEPTDEKVVSELSKRFTPVNFLKGMSGEFYRENRLKDIIDLVFEILSERKEQELVK